MENRRGGRTTRRSCKPTEGLEQGRSAKVERRNPDQNTLFLSWLLCGIRIIGYVSLPVRQRYAEEWDSLPYANRERSDYWPNANLFPAKLNWP